MWGKAWPGKRASNLMEPFITFSTDGSTVSFRIENFAGVWELKKRRSRGIRGAEITGKFEGAADHLFAREDASN